MPDPEEVETTEPTETPEVEAPETDTQPDPFREKWEAQRKVNRDLEAKLKAAQEQIASLGKTEEEIAQERQQREAVAEALSAANQRFLKAEVRRAATGRLADTEDALAFIDLTQFTIGDNGEVDGDEIAAAIDALVERKPHLAAGERKRVPSIPPDPANRPSDPPSLEEQVAAAEKAGDVKALIRLQSMRLLQNNNN